MDISAPLLSYSTQFHWNSHSSDSEFNSMSSPEAISPASPLGCGYLPPHQACGSGTGAAYARTGGTQASVSPSSYSGGTLPGGKVRRNRSKNPSKQRQSASEKEKLRMRDLTKALHHLRTYLPPSVAPAGQTLTKIETLRLTIRYIAHLSAQLGLSEEVLSQRAQADSSRHPNSPEIQGCFRYGSLSDFWGQRQGHRQQPGHYETPFPSEPPTQVAGVEHRQFNSTLELSAQDDLFNSSVDSFLQSPEYNETAHTCQMYCKDLSCQMVSQEFWL